MLQLSLLYHSQPPSSGFKRSASCGFATALQPDGPQHRQAAGAAHSERLASPGTSVSPTCWLQLEPELGQLAEIVARELFLSRGRPHNMVGKLLE